jgi:hypothetical protein
MIPTAVVIKVEDTQSWIPPVIKIDNIFFKTGEK